MKGDEGTQYMFRGSWETGCKYTYVGSRDGTWRPTWRPGEGPEFYYIPWYELDIFRCSRVSQHTPHIATFNCFAIHLPEFTLRDTRFPMVSRQALPERIIARFKHSWHSESSGIEIILEPGRQSSNRCRSAATAA